MNIVGFWRPKAKQIFPWAYIIIQLSQTFQMKIKSFQLYLIIQ